MRLICCLLLVVCTLAAQDAKKKTYLIRLTPAKLSILTAPTAEDKRTLGAHFEHLKRVMADGKLLLAGPSENGEKTFGIVVVETDTEAEARQIMTADPAVKAGLMNGELLNFHLALMKGR